MISSPKEKVRYNSITLSPSNLTARINEPNNLIKPVTLDKESLLTMSYCSRFEICAAPKCPLDVFIDTRTETEEDPKCEMAKATRHKYWESMPEDLRSALPYEGYFRTEYARMKAARERWDSLPEEEKGRIRERMKCIKRPRV